MTKVFNNKFKYVYVVMGNSYLNGYQTRRDWLSENDIPYFDSQEHNQDVFAFETESDRTLFVLRFG